MRAIVGDLVQLSRDVLERRERLAVLGMDHSDRPGDPYQEELAQMEEELERDTRQLQEYVRELQRLGIEPKSATDGLVDFPSIDGWPDGLPLLEAGRAGGARIGTNWTPATAGGNL